MDKEFVPYEQALELKKLGFDEPCLKLWEKTMMFTILVDPSEFKKVVSERYVSSPTFSQAFRWFRENHNLMFQIFYLCNGNYAAIIHRTTPEYMDLVDQVRPSSGCVDEVVDCYSYEEAELECLIKLIELVKNK